MCVGSDHAVKFQLRPAKLPSRPDIPCPLPESQLRLQNDHILRPANVHGFGHYHEVALICAVKFPHPPQVPGRKTWNVRVCSAQMLRCGNGGAFFRPAVDQPPHLAVQLHLRQVFLHQRIQFSEHETVVHRLFDVHQGSSFPAQARLFFNAANNQASGITDARGLILSGIRFIRNPIPPSAPTG